METNIELNINLFPCAGAIFLILSAIFIIELSVKTGINKEFEESSFFESRKAMVTKRYFFIIMFLFCWSLSYVCFKYYLKQTAGEDYFGDYLKETTGKDFVNENLKSFLIGTFSIFTYLYFAASHWRKKPSELEENIERIGKKD